MSISINKLKNESLINGDIENIKQSIRLFAVECELRCMFNTVLWLNELNFSLKCDSKIEAPPKVSFDEEGYESFMRGMVLFKRKCYKECVYYTKDLKTNRGIFIHCLATLKNLDKNKAMESYEIGSFMIQSDYVRDLKILDVKLEQHLTKNNRDGFSYYLRGVVCTRLYKNDEARCYFQTAINLLPMLWDAWQELIKLTKTKEELVRLNLRHHWMREFFLIKMFMKLEKHDVALRLLLEFQNSKTIKDLPSIITDIAVCFQHLRDVTNSLDFFRKVMSKDQFVSENLDVYSNLLYILEKPPEMEILANNMFEHNKYAIETYSVLGDFYSMTGDHQTAQYLFGIAAKECPMNVSYKILQGHEFIELKRMDRAIQCYREAVSINPNDFRTWFGLAAAYEIAQASCQSLFYYRKAHSVHPADSRAICAMGEIYDRRNDFTTAIRCYNSAKNMEDPDGLAITRLAKLYSELKMDDKAAECYEQLIQKRREVEFKIDPESYKFLANYYYERGDYKLAFEYSKRCLEFIEVKKEGKLLLKEIASKEYADRVGETDRTGVMIYDEPLSSDEEVPSTSRDSQ